MATIDYKKIEPAYRDPITGKIFTGPSHTIISDNIPFDDPALKRRAMNSIVAQDENTGFVENGVFMTRAETQDKYGFCQSYQLHDLRTKQTSQGG